MNIKKGTLVRILKPWGDHRVGELCIVLTEPEICDRATCQCGKTFAAAYNQSKNFKSEIALECVEIVR